MVFAKIREKERKHFVFQNQLQSFSIFVIKTNQVSINLLQGTIGRYKKNYFLQKNVLKVNSKLEPVSFNTLLSFCFFNFVSFLFRCTKFFFFFGLFKKFLIFSLYCIVTQVFCAPSFTMSFSLLSFHTTIFVSALQIKKN